jgi:hypothetical protein
MISSSRLLRHFSPCTFCPHRCGVANRYRAKAASGWRRRRKLERRLTADGIGMPAAVVADTPAGTAEAFKARPGGSATGPSCRRDAAAQWSDRTVFLCQSE